MSEVAAGNDINTPGQALNGDVSQALAAAGVTGASNSANATATAAVSITAEAHEEAKGVFASLASKLANFEHALAADAKADIAKLKKLLHLGDSTDETAETTDPAEAAGEQAAQ